MDQLESTGMQSTANADRLPHRLMTFGTFRREGDLVWPLRSDQVSMSAGLFRDLLVCVLAHVQFDESYYLHTYPDVVDALANGLTSLPSAHSPSITTIDIAVVSAWSPIRATRYFFI